MQVWGLDSSWYDDAFIKFVESSGLKFEAMDEVFEERHPTMAKAKVFAANWREMLAKNFPNKE